MSEIESLYNALITLCNLDCLEDTGLAHFGGIWEDYLQIPLFKK